MFFLLTHIGIWDPSEVFDILIINPTHKQVYKFSYL
eukprot:UN10446